MEKVEKKCKIEGCKRPYRAKGYCRSHYKKWRQGEYGKTRYKTCSTEKCLKPYYQAGLCEAHYKDWLKSKGKGEKKPETSAEQESQVKESQKVQTEEPSSTPKES